MGVGEGCLHTHTHVAVSVCSSLCPLLGGAAESGKSGKSGGV